MKPSDEIEQMDREIGEIAQEGRSITEVPRPKPDLREMTRRLREQRDQQVRQADEAAARRANHRETSQNQLFKQLPKRLRPDWYTSEVPFVEEYQRKFHKLWPWEQGIFTCALERLYQSLVDLEGETEAQGIMDACLAATARAKVRGDPKTSPHARYLYRVLEAQVKGKRGEPGYRKR
jgi:hypothetical protein